MARKGRRGDHTRITVHEEPIHRVVEDSWRDPDPNDYAVYGIYNDGYDGSWVLTGLAVTGNYETVESILLSTGSNRRTHYVMAAGHDGLHPQTGVEIDRFDTKRNALLEASHNATEDGQTASERVAPGKYLVRPKHNPTTNRRISVSRGEFNRFCKQATEIRE